MLIINFLKEIKYFFLHHRFSIFIKNIIILLFVNFKKLKKNQSNIYSLGSFKSKINFFSIDELKVFNNNYEDINYIQSLKNLISSGTIIFLINVKSHILIKFLSQTLEKKTILYSDKIDSELKNLNNLRIINNKVNFIDYVKKNKKKSILIIDDFYDLKLQEINKFFNSDFILTQKKIELDENKNYKLFYYDINGKVNFHQRFCILKYFLYSKTELVKPLNKNLISGISVIKDFDIYPFDICYESILGFVDDFYLGIDEKSFNKKYEILLKNFLNKTKYKNKIKIFFNDFQTNKNNSMYTRGRWIADAFNFISNKSQSKYILNLGADELFDLSLNNKFYKEIKKDPYTEEYVFNFSHFLDDLNFIRDPKYAAYNMSTRIFEREKYVCDFDGMGFRKINHLRPKISYTNINIYHIGYLNSFNTKIKKHFSKSGLFSNHMNVKKFKELMHPVKADNYLKIKLLKTLKKYNYLDSYKKII